MADNESKLTSPELKDACDKAFEKYPRSCSHAVWYVMQKYNGELKYTQANNLIESWKTVYVEGSQGIWREQTCERGCTCRGGKSKPGNGHVIVVYPGPEKYSGGFYYKEKRIRMERLNTHYPCQPRWVGAIPWPGVMSQGNKTVKDVWNEKDFHQVRFWVYTGPIIKKSEEKKEDKKKK